MKRISKVALVVGGYLAAFLAASAAVVLHVATTSGPDAQASSGMYAFGDALLFVAVFGGLALVPTGAALVFLRPFGRFWTVLSALGVAVAATGAAAVVLFAVGRDATPPSPLAPWADAAVLRILVAPLLALVFLVCAALAPRRSPRVAFLAATAMEAIVSAYGGWVWALPLLLGS